MVAPFELTLPLSLAYYVVYPESKSVTPKVGVFLRWLREEVVPPAAERRRLRLLAVPGSRARDRPTRTGQGGPEISARRRFGARAPNEVINAHTGARRCP